MNRRFALLALVLAGATAAGAAQSPLTDLAVLRDYQMRRITSADPTGGNHDWRALKPGQTLVLADIKGPGCIVHFRDNVTSR